MSDPHTTAVERVLWSAVSKPRVYLIVPLSVAIAVGLAYLAQQWLPHANLSLVFLIAVLLVAGKTGLGPSIAAALLSFLVYNLLFTAPAFTLHVTEPSEFATLAFFLLVAVLIASLGARMRAHLAALTAGAKSARELNAFSASLAAASGRDEVMQILLETIEAVTHAPAAAIAAETQETRHASPLPREVLNGLRSREPLPGGWTTCELRVGGEPFATLAFAGADPRIQETVHSLCSQSAIVLERIRVAEALEAAKLESETERLRSALLSSVSHDLRTPLASIIGSSSSLIDLDASLAPSARRELIQTIHEEAERLNRYVQNLLDMTRLGQGPISLRRDWIDVRDVVASVLERLKTALQTVRVDVSIAEDVPLLHVHGALVEQAMFNIVHNAVRHSPANGVISLCVRRVEDRLVIDVTDQGPGIPPAERKKVFERFYSVNRGDRTTEGIGLGLAISLGLIGAHGGDIEILDPESGPGTRVRVRLPLACEQAGDG